MTVVLRTCAVAILAFAALLPQGVPAADAQAAPKEDLSRFRDTRTGALYDTDYGGAGPSPGEGDMVTLNYVGTDENGREFANTLKSGKPMVVTLGRLSDDYFVREYDRSPIGGVGKGWDEVLRVMRKGESVTLLMPAELAVLPGTPLLPQDGRLRFKVTVTDIVFANEVASKQAKAEMAAQNVAAPADSKVLDKLGYQTMYDKKDTQKAIQYFRWNLALFPGQSDLYDSLGEGYLQLGDVPQTIEAYRRALAAKKEGNGKLVVARLKADPRSLPWLQEQARNAYVKSAAEKAAAEKAAAAQKSAKK